MSYKFKPPLTFGTEHCKVLFMALLANPLSPEIFQTLINSVPEQHRGFLSSMFEEVDG